MFYVFWTSPVLFLLVCLFVYLFVCFVYLFVCLFFQSQDTHMSLTYLLLYYFSNWVKTYFKFYVFPTSFVLIAFPTKKSEHLNSFLVKFPFLKCILYLISFQNVQVMTKTIFTNSYNCATVTPSLKQVLIKTYK